MTGPDPGAGNAAQAEFWTTGPGRVWAEEYARLDTLMAPLTEALFAQAAIAPGESVLDIGCGPGTTSLGAADRTGPGGRVTGVDISPTLLTVARRRAEGRTNLGFVEADAQTHPFAPAAADLILSRHGLMFFADPAAAFRNLAAALRPGGRITFVAWAEAALNPWVRDPRAAAEARLGQVPPDPPQSPGMFAFAARGYVAGLLRAAGFGAVTAGPLHADFVVAGGAAEGAAFAAAMGPVNYVMRVKSGTEADRAAITRDITRRFRDYETPEGLRVPAVMNLFTATRP